MEVINMFRETPLEQLQELVSRKTGSAVEEIAVYDHFSEICQDGCQIAIGVFSIFYKSEVEIEDNSDDFDREFPIFALTINDCYLGLATLFTSDLTMKEEAAQEMIDKLCTDAGCTPGRVCKKRSAVVRQKRLV